MSKNPLFIKGFYVIRIKLELLDFFIYMYIMVSTAGVYLAVLISLKFI